MANELTGSVWYLDTAGTIISRNVRIFTFLISPTSTDWTVLLKDKNGKIILSASGAAKQPISIPTPACNIEGLTVTTLTNATVTIYS